MRQKYSKPAVQEAIFEAKFNVEGFDSAVPGQIYERVKTKYPNKKDIKSVFFRLGAEGANQGTPPEAFRQRPVIQAINVDGSELIQVGPGIAVANRLIYTKWEEFIPAIETVLDAYISLANPKILKRFGVRYINNFQIKEDNINMIEYFNIGVKLPNKLGSMDGFDWNFLNTYPYKNGQDFKVTIRLYTESQSSIEIGNKFLLDIDCSVESLEIIPKTKNIINLTEEAHKVVSDIFESIITNKTREIMGVNK